MVSKATVNGGAGVSSSSELARSKAKKGQAIRLRDVARKHQVTFIHAIHPSFIPGQNSPLAAWVDWQTKLTILLAFQPTISASTLERGDTFVNMWARMGAVLKGGSVDFASSRDAGSVPSSLDDRQSFGPSEEVDQAIANRRAADYNEFSIGTPEISGFYVCLDRMGGVQRDDLVVSSKIVAVTKQLGIPLYAVKNGVFYEAVYEEKSETITTGKPLSVSDILASSFSLGRTQRQALVESLLLDPPFKIKSDEALFVESNAFGKELYLAINATESQAVRRAIAQRPIDLKMIGQRRSYYFKRDRLYCTVTPRGRAEQNEFSMAQRLDPDHGFIYLGMNRSQDLERPIRSSQDYLDGMEAVIVRVKAQRASCQGDPNQDRSYETWLGKLAFHLYGFGEMAERFGGNDLRDQAFSVAGSALSRGRYDEIRARRIDSTGRFRITLEELQAA